MTWYQYVLIAVVTLATAIFLAVAFFLNLRQRGEMFRDFAREHGLSFEPKVSTERDPLLQSLVVYDRLRWPRAHNVIRGKHRGSEVVVFDIMSSDLRDVPGKTELLSVCVRRLRSVIPYLLIEPRSEDPFTRFDTMRRDARFDVMFESLEFREKFRVCARDRKYAFDFCSALMMDLFLSHAEWHVKVEDGYLIALNGKAWTSYELGEALDFTADVVEHILEFVWHDYGGRTRPPDWPREKPPPPLQLPEGWH